MSGTYGDHIIHPGLSGFWRPCSLYRLLGRQTDHQLFNDDDLLEHLENSDALRYHDEEVEDDYHDKMYDEIMDELFDCYEFNKKEFMKELEDSNADDLHMFLCNLLGIGYYDKEGFEIKWKEFIDKMNKNSYDIKYIKE